MSLKIVHRFHFSSALKRMSAISSFIPAQPGHTHLVSVKGAPEVVKEMVSEAGREARARGLGGGDGGEGDEKGEVGR